MIKKFFISMLGALAAFWLSILVLFVGTLVAIGIIVAKQAGDSPAMGSKILRLNLSGVITERAEPSNFSDMILSGSTEMPQTLDDILKAIAAAKDDKDVTCIFIDCEGSEAGLATREEILEALRDFKQSGKTVMAYADTYTQGDYLLAAQADKVYLNPSGSIDIHGLQSSTIFFTDLLKRMGVKMEIYKVGSYKSAVEPFIRMNMSDPSREQTQVFLSQIWKDMALAMTGDSARSLEAVVHAADSVSFTWPQERYVSSKLVSELKYRRQVEDELRSMLKLKEDDKLPFVTPAEYMAAKDLSKPSGKHIAVLYAVGDIVDDGEGGIVGRKMVPEILKLAKNKDVVGMVLRVNSGGGSAFASEQIWDALEQFKAAGKPLYVSMGDYAASGGYYISCGADSIFADKATLTGSIGIFGMIPNASELVCDKLSIGIDTVSTNGQAPFPSLLFAPSKLQSEGMQASVERGYDLFTRRVAEGRGISQDSVKVIGSGRVWDGQTAVKIGLVDGIAPLSRVVALMAEKVDLDADKVIAYPETEAEVWAQLFNALNAKVDVTVQGMPAEEALEYVRFARTIREFTPMQARMETIILK